MLKVEEMVGESHLAAKEKSICIQCLFSSLGVRHTLGL